MKNKYPFKSLSLFLLFFAALPFWSGAQNSNCHADFAFQKSDCKAWFSNTSQGGSPASVLSYYWTFGDGGNSTDKNPSHEYASNGNYSVCLHITDSATQCYSKICKTVEITNCTTNTQDCKADFGYQKSGCKAWFSNTSQGGSPSAVLSYYWTFGDGGTSYDKNPSHEYTQNGNYSVCLYITDSATQCYSKICKTVEIVGCSSTTGCKADFAFQKSDCSVWFSNTSQGGTNLSYYWTFGDGATSYDKNPFHKYPQNGIYSACLHITDSANQCYSKICKQVEITGCSSTTDCKADFAFQKSDCSVWFSNTSQGGTNLSYYWTFGDGATSNDKNPSHEYAQNGNYSVCLYITDSANQCYSKICKQVEITGCSTTTDCKADFVFQKSECKVWFSNTSQGGSPGSVLSYYWTFGDGGTSTDQNPMHQYLQNGVYQVCLHITDSSSQCYSKICKTVEITGCGNSNGCQPRFEFKVEGCHVTFFNVSQGGTSTTVYDWSFGDGGTSSDKNPTHSYASNGVYTVCMKMRDSSTNCEKAFCAQVNITNCSNDTTGCKARYEYKIENCEVQFFNVSSGSSNTGSFYWSFGDGSTSTDYSPHHTYSHNGVYEVCLKMTGINCESVYCEQIQITNCNSDSSDCKAYFVYKVDSCKVSFFNASSGTTQYKWTFGDGSTSTAADPVHVYAHDGTYGVCLTAWNADKQCEAHYCMQITVQGCGTNQQECKAWFSYKVKDRHVKFKDLSTGGITSWYWDFGDGYMSTVRHPKHMYDQGGKYTVCLTVKNEQTGCKDMVCREIEVKKRKKHHPENSHNTEISANEKPIPQEKAAQQLNIYPNPVQGETLYLESSVVAGETLTITDSFGKLMYRSEKGQIPNQVDISNLQTGMYLLTITSSDSVMTKRFFVSK